MKEIYLAMEKNGLIFGYTYQPRLDDNELWCADGNMIFSKAHMYAIGIDVTKFPLTQEQPIKIRAVWEQIND